MNAGEILAAFPRLRVLVVGDVCLDRWCHYDPRLAEPSRETGIPRTAVISTEVTPGAAGTIASNLIALGAGRVAVLGVIGDDGHGQELVVALAARGIGSDSLLRSPEIATFTYTKLINAATDVEDIPRVDFINTQPLPDALEGDLCRALDRVANEFDVVLVSDQAETDAGGVVTPRLRERLSQLAATKLVWVDSRRRPEHFRNVVLKPNRDEANAALARMGAAADRALFARAEARLLVITDGPRGVLLVDSATETRVTTDPIANPVDVCGAGDSFSAGAAMALEVTGSAVDAAKFGNLVASITIMKKGTGVATPAEVLEAAASE